MAIKEKTPPEEKQLEGGQPAAARKPPRRPRPR